MAVAVRLVVDKGRVSDAALAVGACSAVATRLAEIAIKKDIVTALTPGLLPVSCPRIAPPREIAARKPVSLLLTVQSMLPGLLARFICMSHTTKQSTLCVCQGGTALRSADASCWCRVWTWPWTTEVQGEQELRQ